MCGRVASSTTAALLAGALAASVVAADTRSATLDSETPAPPALGTRLRLTLATNDHKVAGSLVALDASTLTLRVEDRRDATVVRRDALTRVEVSAGHASRGHGALLGLAIGAATGAVVGIVGGAASAPEERTYGAAASGAIGAFLLGSVGAGVGLLIPPGEKWSELPLDRVRVTLAPARGPGVAVTVALAF